MSLYAKVIADSTYRGHRATSMEVSKRRFTLAELNTHRLISRPEADAPFFMEEFSRNSASSRAMPVAKVLSRILESPAYPVSWPQEKAGMQGGEELGETDTRAAKDIWKQAIDSQVEHVEKLRALGLHKSVTNRLLEFGMEHTVVLTATNWQGFWDQRLDKNAQPEIRETAEMMKAAYDESTPRELGPNQWHLPYIEREDITAVEKRLLAVAGQGGYGSYHVTRDLVQISTARCARVSYLTQDGRRDIVEDFTLYDRLVSASPVHYSPAEHVCTPAPNNVQRVEIRPRFGGDTDTYIYVGPRYGNFTGWHQHRFDLMGV